MIYLSNGNTKVDAITFNLPTKITCKKGLLCWHYCYAAKAERLYPKCLPCRKRNLAASKQRDFVDKVVKLLKRRKKQVVRIHESGDFYSQLYAAKWFLIASKCPEKTFYAYTKRDDLFDAKLLNLKPDNFILIYSVDGIDKPSTSVKSGYNKIALVKSKKTNCPAIKDATTKCMRDCSKCINKTTKCIVFKKH